MMEKNIYQEIISEVSEKLSEKIIGVEKNLAARATLIDQDINNIVQEIGLQTTKNVLENTRDEIVLNKKARGMSIHKNPTTEFNIIFGKIKIKSPYLWPGTEPSEPLTDEMKITHQGRSEAVKRALSDFGADESFGTASKKFKEHYHFEIGISTVDRTTKEIGNEASEYVENKLSSVNEENDLFTEKVLTELDGCEIRTAEMHEVKDSDERTPVHNNPIKEKDIKWRDVRIGFARPLEQKDKIFVGKMDSYPEVVSQLHSASELTGMTSESEVVGVADGANGLSEELKRQFPNMIFILDKPHLRDHLYDTAEKMGISKEERAKWVEPRIRIISNGEVEKIIEELEELQIKNEDNEKSHERLKRLAGYLNRFCDALYFDSFKENGYPVGSGEIESAHKSIPQKRLKIPGATWNPNSIDPMLALRILIADDWWDDFWDQRTEKLLAA